MRTIAILFSFLFFFIFLNRPLILNRKQMMEIGRMTSLKSVVYPMDSPKCLIPREKKQRLISINCHIYLSISVYISYNASPFYLVIFMLYASHPASTVMATMELSTSSSPNMRVHIVGYLTPLLL
jgi:hypothetical protein